MDLKIDITEDETTSTVMLTGEIDAYTAPKLKEALIPLSKKEGNVVEVNLGNVGYMDSTGLGVFIAVLKSTKENQSFLKLVDLQERVLRLFTITGVNEIIDIDSTIRGGKE